MSPPCLVHTNYYHIKFRIFSFSSFPRFYEYNPKYVTDVMRVLDIKSHSIKHLHVIFYQNQKNKKEIFQYLCTTFSSLTWNRVFSSVFGALCITPLINDAKIRFISIYSNVQYYTYILYSPQYP